MSKDSSISIRIKSTLRARLDHYAANNNATISEIVTEALEEEIAKHDFMVLYEAQSQGFKEMWERNQHGSSYKSKLGELGELIRVRNKYGRV